MGSFFFASFVKVKPQTRYKILDTKQVIVVGGGTAGWITAARVAAHHRSGVQVTLIESPNIPTIGVGEGTWPTMRQTLRKVGLSEEVFLRETFGSFKQGTWFHGWSRGGDEEYLHPFSLPLEYPDTTAAELWLADSTNDHSFSAAVTPQDAVVKSNKAPKQASTPEYAFNVNYGYHFDAGKFAEVLKRHSVDSLGVKHVLGDVTGVQVNESSGVITSVSLESGVVVEGDLFVDCTGQRGLLIDGHCRVGHVEVSSTLFNDRAIAVQVPYGRDNASIASATLATATSVGWIWDIGLQNRRGIGHVFSSSFSSEDDAQLALERYLVATSPELDLKSLAFRVLKFESKYREVFWQDNVVAVGLSAGFVEPLEASAIAMIEQSAEFIVEHLTAAWEAMPPVSRKFNSKMTHHWERIVAFLKLHYVLSSRSDSDYWISHRLPEHCPQDLLDSLEIWKHQIPAIQDFPRVDELFPAASYQYVLYGMCRPANSAPSLCQQPKGKSSLELESQLRRKREELVQRLPTNRDLLTHIAANA